MLTTMQTLEWYFTTHLYLQRQKLLYPDFNPNSRLIQITMNPPAVNAIIERLDKYPPSKKELAIVLRNLHYSYPKIQKMINYSPNYISKADKIRHEYNYPLKPLLKIDEIPRLNEYIESWNDFRTFAKKHGKDIF
jgi:hypothetical protein